MNSKNNNLIKAIFCLTILIGLTFMVGCGGGSGGGSDGTSGGGSTSGVSQGQIEGFGSVFVNGVEWETDSVEIEFEGSPGFSESDLQIGMLVKVEGSLDDNGTTGTATSIRFDDNLEGPISNPITTSSTGLVKTLLVMGQTVIVENGVTFFDNNDPTILGVEVNTNTINDDDFKDDDTIIGRTAFFNRLAAGDLVKARFRANAWDQIEFED